MSQLPTDEILSLLLSLPPGEREAALLRECGNDGDRAKELRSLLRVHDASPRAMQLPAHADLRLPEKIGRYPVLETLGRGGMGTVYLGIDPELRRRIAIKVLSPEIALRLSDEHIRREGQMLAAVAHPNLATVYSLEMVDGITFLTMELIAGRTLADRLRDGAIPLRECLLVFRQIALAVAAAHRRRVIHRDLSAANVCVDENGFVKVLDFGLSKLLLDEHVAASWPGQPVGTPGYMSPEQVRGEPVDERTDIWSFGCLFYEALTGASAFGSGNVASTLMRTIQEEPDYSRLPRETSDELRALLSRCLAKTREDRADSMDTVLNLIELELAGGRAPVRITPDRGVGHLPTFVSTLVGRERELAQVQTALEQSRLVTLKGIGGCGKTRIAVEAAGKLSRQFPGGAWFVALAPMPAQSPIVPEVLKVLGVVERPHLGETASLVDHLRQAPTLLLLDNCEHLLAHVSAFAYEILMAVPSLRIMATSRQSLSITGESIIPISPLPVAPFSNAGSTTGDALSTEGLPRLWSGRSLSPDELSGPVRLDTQPPAVRLFVERAREVRPDFQLTHANRASVLAICQHLDGLPLAIELAAARTRSLPVSELAARLSDRFTLLAQRHAVANPRHHSLGLSMDYSHDLLEPEEQVLFRRLAIFPDHWSLAAAETICTDDQIPTWRILDLMDGLVDHSLVEIDVSAHAPQGGLRYRMLETVREYATRRLHEKSERSLLLDRHLRHFLVLAEDAFVSRSPETWAARLDEDRRNLDLALQTSLDHSDPNIGLRLGAAIARHWDQRGQWRQGRAIIEKLVARAGDQTPPLLLARAYQALGNLSGALEDWSLAHTYSLRARELARRAPEDIDARRIFASATNSIGVMERSRGNYAEAIRCCEEALATHRENKSLVNVARALINISDTMVDMGDTLGAIPKLEESLAIPHNDLFVIATSLHSLGLLRLRVGNVPEAARQLEKSLDLRRRLHDPQGIADSLAALAEIARERGDILRSQSLLQESIQELGDIRPTRTLARILKACAELALARERPDLTLELLAGLEKLLEDRRAVAVPEAQRVETLRKEAEEALGHRADSVWPSGSTGEMLLERTTSILSELGNGTGSPGLEAT